MEKSEKIEKDKIYWKWRREEEEEKMNRRHKNENLFKILNNLKEMEKINEKF